MDMKERYPLDVRISQLPQSSSMLEFRFDRGLSLIYNEPKDLLIAISGTDGNVDLWVRSDSKGHVNMFQLLDPFARADDKVPGHESGLPFRSRRLG